MPDSNAPGSGTSNDDTSTDHTSHDATSRDATSSRDTSHNATPARHERAPVRLFIPQPYLRVDNAERAIAFYVAAFHAQLVVKLVEPGGRVAHAELRMGKQSEASLMLSDEYPESNLLGPNARGGSTAAMQLYVENVDALCERVRAAGGTVMKPPATDPFGDRGMKVVDPCGHEWLVSERVETITAEQMQSRFNKMIAE